MRITAAGYGQFFGTAARTLANRKSFLFPVLSKKRDSHGFAGEST